MAGRMLCVPKWSDLRQDPVKEAQQGVSVCSSQCALTGAWTLDETSLRICAFGLESTPSTQTGADTPSSTFSATTPHSNTPSSNAASSNPPTPALPNTNMSLDAFQNTYTSEDNASFSTILRNSNEDRKHKYKWIFDPESKQLVLTAPPDAKEGNLLSDGSSTKKSTPVLEWKYKARNHLMYVPEGEALSASELTAARPGPPKSITHAATRLASSNPSKQNILDDQQAQDRMKTHEAWKELSKATPSLFPRASTPAGPHVGGYSFVSATPSPAPHRDVDPSDLMTWGMIEGTPLLVDSGGDHGGPAFKMAPTPRREVVGMKLSERASKSLRSRAIGNGSLSGSSLPGLRTPKREGSRIGSPSVRNGMLSPAAKKLLGKSRGIGGFGDNMQLRASYTPRDGSRGRVSSVTPSPSVGNSRFGSVTPSQPVRAYEAVSREATVGPEIWEGGTTPGKSGDEDVTRGSTSNPHPSTQKSSITDGLLQF